VVRISKSSLSAYMECPKRYYYNLHLRGKGILSEPLMRGIFIHKIIEECKTLTDALDKYNESLGYRFMDTDEVNKDELKMIHNYYEVMKPQLPTKGAKYEQYFRLKWDNHTEISGVFDYVNRNP
jgi:hypothetical protein